MKGLGFSCSVLSCLIRDKNVLFDRPIYGSLRMLREISLIIPVSSVSWNAERLLKKIVQGSLEKKKNLAENFLKRKYSVLVLVLSAQILRS